MHPQSSGFPEVFRQQIQARIEGSSPDVNHFLFWVEKAQSHSYQTSGEEAVTWYRNAMLIYDFLERREGKPFLSRIYVRLSLIKVYGYHHDVSKPYLDEINAWMVQDLPADTAQLSIDIRQWMQLSPERIRKLRMLEMKLNIAQQLEEQGLTLNEEIRAFIPLRTALP